MARKRKTKYTKKAKRQTFMQSFGSDIKTKGSVKNTAIATGKDILICVLGGGLIGAAIGRPSLAVGMAATGLGHYSGNKLTQLLGIGMMAANGFQRNTTVSGIEGLDGVKERVQAFKESISERLYLDKLKRVSSTGTTSGFGDLQYFSYPNNDLAALDDIENQLSDSAMQFQSQLPQSAYDIGDVGDLDGHLF